MGIRKILRNVNNSYNDYLEKSEREYNAKQKKFFYDKNQKELEIRKAEDHEGRKRGEKPLDSKYMAYGSESDLNKVFREMQQENRTIKEPSSPSRSQFLKARGTKSSAIRKIIK